MTRGRWILISVILALMFGLAAVLLSRTRLELSGRGLEDGRLEVETNLPLLTCRKTFLSTFPFVTLECKDAEPSERAKPEDTTP